MRILILGGTTQARILVERLSAEPSIVPILSLAGRTKSPILPAVNYRIGGFGGVAGLASYLRREAINLVIDATHPFAEQMSAHAEAACRTMHVGLVRFTRLPWKACSGDRWHEVENAEAAAATLGADRRRVFLTIGRLQLPAFEAAPVHDYLIRAIDPPAPAPKLPNYRLLLARGPFSVTEEIRLMKTEAIEILVTKNSGGDATYAKIEAARTLGLPVVLLQPPEPAQAAVFHDIEPLLSFIRESAH